jgi:EmrB/QacA subfamily drug resistance transporter
LKHKSSPPTDGASAVGHAPSQTKWVLATTILASSMAFIDSTALNVTLPAIQVDLGATGKQLLWVVNAYLLLLSALILLGGSMGDRYGRKRVFLIGIAAFAIGSLASGLSTSSVFLIGARAFQGAGGALMIPGSLSIITASVPATERGRAIGTWSAVTTLTTILGPLLGGFLASAGLWRVVFFINPPLGAIALFGLVRHVPESRDPKAKSLDLAGAALVTFSLACLTYGAVEASETGLRSITVLAALTAGIAALAVFVAYERRTPHPLLPMRLFQSATFAGTNLLTLMLYAGLNVAMFFFSLILIQAQGYPARLAGLALLPFSILLTALSRWAGGLADREGPRGFLIAGPVITGIGFFALGLPAAGTGPSQYWTAYLPPITAIGVGMGLTVAPLTSAVMGSVRESQAGTASGINNAIARVGGVLAVAIVGGIALMTFQRSLADLSGSIPISSQQRRALLANASKFGETQPPDGVVGDARAAVQQVIDQSLIDTFRATSSIAAALAVLAGLLGGWMTSNSPSPSTSEGAKTPSEIARR